MCCLVLKNQILQFQPIFLSKNLTISKLIYLHTFSPINHHISYSHCPNTASTPIPVTTTIFHHYPRQQIVTFFGFYELSKNNTILLNISEDKSFQKSLSSAKFNFSFQVPVIIMIFFFF